MSLIGRSEEKLAAAAELIGAGVATAAGNVTDPTSLDGAILAVVAQQGPCDVLISAAGGAEPGYFLDLSPEVFRRQMELNYFGTLHAVRAVLPDMVSGGGGHLVLVSSVAGVLGVFGYSAYAPAKFAVRGLGETLAAEFGTRGIHVSVVYPPDTQTPGFDRENATKPVETVRISASVRPLPAARVAASIVKGIERERLTITADIQTAVLVRSISLVSPLVRALMRRAARD